MKVEHVPQDQALFHGERPLAYAVDSKGEYSLVNSAGWDPANVANQQAWLQIEQEVCRAKELVEKRKRSPLFYHMVRNQMTISLLASYSGFSRFTVWRHLRPKSFLSLPREKQQVYADIFTLSVEELLVLPKDCNITSSTS